MKILIFFFPFMLVEVLSKKWVDPHDMNLNVKDYMESEKEDLDYKKEKWADPHEIKVGNVKRSFKNSVAEDVSCGKENCDSDIGENTSLIYLKRFINLLLDSANLDKTDTEEYLGHLYFTISNDELKFLKSFSTMENVSIKDLRKLDTILSKSMERSYLDSISDTFLSLQEKIYQFVFNHNCLPMLALLLFPYISYNLIKSNFSTWYIFRYSVVMVFMFDFVQRYQQLFEEAEEHNMQLKYSLKCDTSKMSWGQYFKFLTGNEDCEKKVVSLLEVLLNQIKNVIIIPLAAVGTGMGQFGSGLWKNLPFPWNILIFPIMLVFIAILTAIVITSVSNTPFKFNIMHLLHLEFGNKKEGITGKTLDKILDAVSHRPLLQEVKSAKDKNYKPQQKKKSGPKAVENKKEKESKEKSFKRKDSNSDTSTNSINSDGGQKNVPKVEHKNPGNSV